MTAKRLGFRGVLKSLGLCGVLLGLGLSSETAAAEPTLGNAPTVTLTLTPTTFAANATPTAFVQVSCNYACGLIGIRYDGVEVDTPFVDGNGAWSGVVPSNLALGTHTLQVHFYGSLNSPVSPPQADSNVVNFTIVPNGSAVTSVVAYIGSTSFFENAVPNASVQVGCHSTCGMADFRIDGNEFETVPLSASGSFTTNGLPPLPVGPHTLQVVYLGDATYAGASSNVVSFTVLPYGSIVPTVVATLGSTAFRLSAAPMAAVQVSCNSACGKVDYQIDGSEWGTVNLGPAGSFSTSQFPSIIVGPHTLQIFYLGNETYAPAASNAIPFTVIREQDPNAPLVTLSLSAATFPLSAPATATVLVGCKTLCAGTYADFKIDGGEWGTVALDASGSFSASSFPPLALGTHTLQVYFQPGYTSLPESSSNVVPFTVVPNGSTAVSVVASMGSMSFVAGAAPHTLVQVNCNSACGLADFRIDGNEWGTVPLGSSGSFMTYGLPALSTGAHTLQVFYLGNATYAASSSNVVSFTLLPNGTTVPSVVATLGFTTFPIAASPTAAVQVGCNAACGLVDYRIDGQEWGTVALNASGSFSATQFPPLSLGAHTLQIFYLGSAAYAPATSNVIPFTVIPNGTTVPSVVFSMASTSFKLGSPPSTSVQVSCNTACGLADFKIDGAEWGTVPLGSSGAFVTSGMAPLTVGPHSLQVFYLGNATYAAAPSNSVSFTVVSSGVTATPAFTPVAGSYSTAQNVAITDATPGATTYYTTDGSTPTTASTVYSGPIPVASTKTIKAIALAPGYTVSALGSSAYTISIVGVTVNGAGQVRLGSTAQFTATLTNTTNQAVTWKVNSIVGGSATVGTISATGLYTPPVTLPSVNPVTITAVSTAAPTASGTATEAVWNPLPAVSSATVTVINGAATGLLDVTGTGFVSGAQLQVAGSSVTTAFVSGTELQATIPVAAGTTMVAVDVLNPNPGGIASTNANASVTALKASQQTAARLLDQATFGPTLADIQHVETVGTQAYLNEQFALPATLEPDIANPAPLVCMNNVIPCQQSEWWQTALTAPDQLRQRVAFALSEMMVISTNSVNARSVTTYQNLLAKDAFSNFYTIMKDVSLSPGMGAYLNMLNSAKPATINGVVQIANENYPRELMQLFTTGIDTLNQDGSLQLDANGNTIPVYTETQVQAFARAYTGWTYGKPGGAALTSYPNYTSDFDDPMQAYEAQHDTGAKALLNGTTLPAGQTSAQDLTGALTNIFNHPNVGPFVSKQLIQHLVASQPSPAYVSRVAAVFANDGTGVRGNMKAVIQAILNDQDARAGDGSQNFDGGHLREPMLYLTNVVRGLGFTNNDAVAGNDVVANASYSSLSNYTSGLGQKPYTSPSVFNFFPPDYVIPGTATNAPEFSQENTATSVLRLSLANTLVFNGISGFTVNLGATSALGMMASATGNATTDSTNLVNALSTIFMHGQMPSQMSGPIIAHVASIVGNPAQRVRVATYLVITASQYKIEH